MTRRRKLLLWVILFGIPITSVLILDRLFANLAADRSLTPSNEHFFEYDSVIGGVHKKNIRFKFRSEEIAEGHVWMTTNNLGFREDDATSFKKESEYRVIVFGDSHTDGVANNEDTFPNVAENQLRVENLDVEVINAGVMGFSPYQQLLAFEESLGLEPDIAVFTFYCGNDYLDLLSTSKPYLTVDENGDIVRNPPPSEPELSLIQVLSKHSAIVNACASLVENRGEKKKQPERMQKALDVDIGMVWQSMNQGLKLPNRFEQASRLNEFVVQTIQEIGRRNSIDIVFLTLPTSYQIQSQDTQPSYTRIEELFELDADDKIDDRVLADVTRLANKYQMASVDPTLPLTESPKPVYWRFDQHLNVEGCRIVGQALADEITNRLTHKLGDDN